MEENKKLPCESCGYEEPKIEKFKIKDVVLSLLIISVLFLGWKTYSLDSRLTTTEQGLLGVINFINQAIANQPK